MPISEKQAAPARPLPSRSRTPAVTVTMVLILLAVVFVVPEGLWLTRAATVLSRANPTPLVLRIFLKLQRAGVTSSDATIQAANHIIPVHIYTPLHVAHPPVIVLVHGLAPEGYRDNYLNYIAVRMALLGFQAIVPNIASEQQMKTSAAGMRDIGDTVKWSSERAHARVSLFGVSFGGGLAVAAAEDPAYSPYVRMVFDLSGYDSLQRLGHYYIHDKVTGPDGVPYPPNPPISGTVVVAMRYLDDLVPAGQVVPLHNSMLPLLDSRGPDWPAAEANLNPEQRQTLETLFDMRSPEVRQRYARIIDAHSREDAEVSPEGKFGQLRCPLYVLHGSGDTSIPEGEAEWARVEIPPGVQAHFLITPDMAHAVTASVNKWHKLGILFLMADALETASVNRSAPR